MVSTLIAATCLMVGAPPERPALTGIVQDEKGKPVAGATVFISTAAVRKGVGVL